MGHHYVPQRHLRKFEIQDDLGCVWECNKLYKKWSKQHIGKVAQIKNYYPAEIEQYLANTIETNGGNSIDIILKRNKINQESRKDLAMHLGCMMIRTPAARKFFKQTAVPAALKETFAEVRGKFNYIKYLDVDKFNAIMEKISEVEKEYDNKLPEDAENYLNSPIPSDNVVDTINEMQWEVWYTEDSECFLTSDNPFFLTKGIGLKGAQDSQFFLPLSHDTVLYGHQYHYYNGIPLLKVPSRVVRQINRRTIANADCRIYSSQKMSWIPVDFSESDHKQYLQWDRKVLKNLLKVH